MKIKMTDAKDMIESLTTRFRGNIITVKSPEERTMVERSLQELTETISCCLMEEK
jgi:hypothetical protein